MAEFIFTGTVTLRGVDFYIEADTQEEAAERAKKGDFDKYEAGCFEIVDWDISPENSHSNE